MSVEQRLAELGLSLPPAPQPIAAYVPGVQAGNLLFTSGQLPLQDGDVKYQGRVGVELTVEQGYDAARLCTLNALAVIKAMAGSLDRVKRVCKVVVFVHCDAAFDRQPEVGNGASDLLVELFGEAGKHARSAVGTNALPRRAAVEVELIVELV